MSTPRQIGPYAVDTEIEPGSLGRRFSATFGGRAAIVEMISVHCDVELFERSIRRIELMTTVRHHHLVPILDAGLDRDDLYVVTPRPDRTAEEIRPIGAAAREVIASVADGLLRLHDHDVVHRDLQLRHIGWYDGVVQLGGFGLSDMRGAGRTHGVGPIGGVLTMAPSIVRGQAATVGSDAYSLGAALHLLATGFAVHAERPESLAGRVARIGAEPPVIDPSLAPALAPILERALALDGVDDRGAVTDLLIRLSQPTTHPDQEHRHDPRP